jgi:hypothetical protein
MFRQDAEDREQNCLLILLDELWKTGEDPRQIDAKAMENSELFVRTACFHRLQLAHLTKFM